MTKLDVLDIIESNNKELINKYMSDPEFVAIIKQLKEETSKELERNRKEQESKFQQEQSKIIATISNLLEKNKNTVSNPKVLSLNPKLDERDIYEDTIDSFTNNYKPESTTGNVLVCTYNTNKLTLEVNGIYQNVTAINFGNEIVFITDGKTIIGLGDGDNTSGEKKIQEFLRYLEGDILNPNFKIDPNLFNTGADYFVLINNY